jgi:hypothetical protein
MRAARLLCLATAIALSLAASPAEARLLAPVGYDELFDKSDLVVIAEPAGKTRDTSERTFFEGIDAIDAKGVAHRVPAIGVATPFNVIKVLKGDPRIKHFVLHHYREGKGPGLNGPLVVSFDPTGPLSFQAFLLFLHREPDGRYAPSMGQTDPGDRAISLLQSPL